MWTPCLSHQLHCGLNMFGYTGWLVKHIVYEHRYILSIISNRARHIYTSMLLETFNAIKYILRKYSNRSLKVVINLREKSKLHNMLYIDSKKSEIDILFTPQPPSCLKASHKSWRIYISESFQSVNDIYLISDYSSVNKISYIYVEHTQDVVFRSITYAIVFCTWGNWISLHLWRANTHVCWMTMSCCFIHAAGQIMGQRHVCILEYSCVRNSSLWS